EIVGSNFAVRWGSAGFFGPLSVRPDLWGEKIAQRLMEATMQRFADWRTTHVAFFTFAESAKHVALYGKFGFHPRFLTAIMARPVTATTGAAPAVVSALSASERHACLDDARRLTGTLFDGLDVGSEITSLTTNGLGDTVLVRDRGGVLRGLATCHVGRG